MPSVRSYFFSDLLPLVLHSHLAAYESKLSILASFIKFLGFFFFLMCQLWESTCYLTTSSFARTEDLALAAKSFQTWTLMVRFETTPDNPRLAWFWEGCGCLYSGISLRFVHPSSSLLCIPLLACPVSPVSWWFLSSYVSCCFCPWWDLCMQSWV